MSVPLSSGESVIGALTLYASAPASFSEDQGRLVQMIAPHVADAIVRARRIASAVELPQRDRGAQRRELRLVESQTA